MSKPFKGKILSSSGIDWSLDYGFASRMTDRFDVVYVMLYAEKPPEEDED